jgi:nanoRNase/pAp phosphatase (c-di-AMP/oligoRNAs hydrolase)
MELSTLQQISDYINRARKILLAMPVHVTIDRLCSAYALSHVLAKMGKETALASAAQVLPNIEFLSDPPFVNKSFASGQSLVIDVSTANAQLDELSYQNEADKVQIFLKARGNAQFSPSDVSVTAGVLGFDLVVILGAQTLEDLGSLYQQNTELFFNTPKINLDIAPGNEYFGTINLIDVTASSVAEVAAQVIAALEQAVTDEDVATSLLGGIIANTHSFQDPATTPNTLTTASALIAQGARQQDIIKTLYKTKDFALLKLWGRALARIKTVPETSLLYSMLTRSDFEKTGEDGNRLILVLREMLENVAGFQTVALLGEQANGTRLLLAGLPHANILNLVHKLTEEVVQPTPLLGLYQVVELDLPQPIAEAEQSLLNSIREK